MTRSIAMAMLFALCLVVQAGAEVITPSTRDGFISALNSAVPGDQILLHPGTYAGGIFAANVEGVTIGSLDPDNPAVIQGGTNAMQLSDAVDVTIQDLIIEHSDVNGLNLDDGGSFETPARNITLRNLIVRNIGSTGNHDGIKLSGVTGFHVQNVHVDTWGTGGSAIDMVGSHNGVIENSLFTHDTISNGGTAVRPKGGSKNITIRANRIELNNNQGRAIQFGGSTDAEFFRFIDGDSGYEADSMVAEGNVVVGGSSAFSWSVIDGGDVHHNAMVRPDDWVLRILNENPSVGGTLNGRFFDNVVVFGDALRTHVNDGPDTEPGTFEFADNTWYNADTPGESTPSLPSAETGGVVGVDPGLDIGSPIVWEFDWGVWIVNANSEAGSAEVDVPAGHTLSRATPVDGDAMFAPTQADPLLGNWSFTVFPGGTIELEPFSQVILVQAIPEPGSWGILLAALFGVMGRRGRRGLRRNLV